MTCEEWLEANAPYGGWCESERAFVRRVWQAATTREAKAMDESSAAAEPADGYSRAARVASAGAGESSGGLPGPRCPQCDGEGTYGVPGSPMAACPRCRGSGRLAPADPVAALLAVACAERDAYRERVALLEAALRPFARYGAALAAQAASFRVTYHAADVPAAGDYHRAAAALAAPTPEAKAG